MFNTTNNHYSETEHVPYCKEVNVTENRAPTDDSVRLLNEFQDKAKDNIIETIIVDQNVMKAVIVVYYEQPATPSLSFHIKFDLNGKTHIVKEQLNLFNLSMNKNSFNSYVKDRAYINKLFDILVKSFSEAIARDVIRMSPEFVEQFIKR